jgi:hypothetical protein
MRFEEGDARQHRSEYYAVVFAGHRAVRLVDDDGRPRGELAWRLATGPAVEITEFGIYDAADRRQAVRRGFEGPGSAL